MKKSKMYFRLFTGLVVLLFLNQSCEKPFDGVNAILTNVKIDHKVTIQIIDANPKATKPYPANPVITLAGAAVDQGLLYTTAGTLLNSSSGSAKAISNAVTIAVKPFTVISKDQPLKFFIKAEAPNYISNAKEIPISSVDSLQYVNLELLNLAKLPEGVNNTSAQTAAVNGTITEPLPVSVKSGTTKEEVVSAIIPAGIVFKDVDGKTITSSGELSISVTSFSGSTEESATALPGGTTASINGVVSTFIVAGAVDIDANIGGTNIKNFDKPIPFGLKLSNSVFNPKTNSTIQEGDQIPVWSKDANSVIWKSEGFASVVKDGNGALKTTIQVTHLSTWMVAFDEPLCANTTVINFVSNSDKQSTVFIKVNVAGGSNQLTDSKTYSLMNGNFIEFQLAKNLNYTVKMYLGVSDQGTLLNTINLAPCAASGTLTNTLVSTNPTLVFDLQTRCPNGDFRYDGGIEYKESGTRIWGPFGTSVGGKLTTDLLAWDKTYDFRIIYRDVEYSRSRKVVQSEFRQAANGSWEYFGKSTVQQTFFNSPTACN